jgi:hypothetical protein
MKIKYNSNTMIVYPATADELNQVASKLKGKLANGFEYQYF